VAVPSPSICASNWRTIISLMRSPQLPDRGQWGTSGGRDW
jgi:hypothetical protein